MIRCVLFDLEGTLVDFQWKLEEAEAELRRAAAGVLGCGPERFAGLNYAGIWKAAMEAGAPGLRARVEQTLEPIYDRYDLDAATRWTLQPGASSVLTRLQALGVPTGLVTNVGRRSVAHIVTRLGIDGRFGVVVTRNDVPRMKPAPEGIHKALAALGATAAEALMVGDSLSDIGAARAAGCRVAIVLGGESTEAAIRAARPDLVLTDLREVVGSLCEPLERRKAGRPEGQS
ncbi:MAG: HAD family hydrolase [Deltaproteobacteria bacterium]|nr:HAD family hydrolase [Deltaproteobacteria bacterium]